MNVVFFFISDCTISPKSPSSLTSKGGGLANNTKAVEIECRCVDSVKVLLRNVKWYSPANLLISSKSTTVHHTPYFRLIRNKKVSVLVIPNFIDVYNGEYTCVTPNRSTMTTIDCK